MTDPLQHLVARVQKNRRSQDDYRPQDAALMHGVERLLHLADADALGDELLQRQPAWVELIRRSGRSDGVVLRPLRPARRYFWPSRRRLMRKQVGGLAEAHPLRLRSPQL